MSGSVSLAGVSLGRPQVVTGLVALLLVAVLFVLVYRTRWGHALQAVAEDRRWRRWWAYRPTASMPRSGCWAAPRSAWRALLTTFFYVFPSVGTVFGLLAFVAVCMGGFGSLPGAFIAGILIGIIEAMTGYFVAPALKTVSVFILFILVLWYRPKGLFGRW